MTALILILIYLVLIFIVASRLGKFLRSVDLDAHNALNRNTTYTENETKQKSAA